MSMFSLDAFPQADAGGHFLLSFLAAPADSSALGGLTDLIQREGFYVAKTVALSIALLAVGWIVAKIAASVVSGLLRRTNVDDRIASALGTDNPQGPNGSRIERGAGKVTYWVVMLLVFVAVLQFAGLTQVAAPLQGVVDTLGSAVPSIGKAALILLVAYVLGRVLGTLAAKALDALGLERRFAKLDEGAEAPKPFGETASKIVFALVMLFGLGGAFDALQISPISDPLKAAIDRFVGALPMLVTAAIIAVAGWVLGRIARSIVRNLLQGLQFERLTERLRVRAFFGKSDPADVAGWVVMAFIVLQAGIAALNELGLATLATPLTNMVAQFWDLLPSLAVSGLIVAIGYVVGTVAKEIAVRLLEGAKFDALMKKIGLDTTGTSDDARRQPSQIVGALVQLLIVLVAVAQAAANLGLATWAGYLDTFLAFAVSDLLVALVIAAGGFALANYVRSLLARRGVGSTAETTTWVAEIARGAILVFAGSMALHHVGVAETFVLSAFSLLFGALCLALALSFGLGSREVAGDIVKRRYQQFRGTPRSHGGPPTPPRPPQKPTPSPSPAE